MAHRVFVTGGTGFIGSYIVEALRARGYDCGCLARPGSDTTFLEGLGANLVYGDIRDEARLRMAMKEYAAVIHAAALASDWGNVEDFRETNVTGTLNVMKAARLNGIAKIIVTGSVSVYGEENHVGIKDERSPFNPHHPYPMERFFPSAMNFYRDSKAMAEREAISYAEAHGMDLTILEPVFVFREREFHSGFYEYVKSTREGLPVTPGSRKNNFHVIYAPDLARAFLLCVEKRFPGINKYIIGNRHAENMDRLFGLFCRHAGARQPTRIPRWTIYPVALLLELVYTLMRTKNPPLLTRARVDMFYDNVEYSVEKAERKLGFNAATSLHEGIRRTVEWYVRHGYL